MISKICDLNHQVKVSISSCIVNFYFWICGGYHCSFSRNWKSVSLSSQNLASLKHHYPISVMWIHFLFCVQLEAKLMILCWWLRQQSSFLPGWSTKSGISLSSSPHATHTMQNAWLHHWEFPQPFQVCIFIPVRLPTHYHSPSPPLPPIIYSPPPRWLFPSDNKNHGYTGYFSIAHVMSHLHELLIAWQVLCCSDGYLGRPPQLPSPSHLTYSHLLPLMFFLLQSLNDKNQDYIIRLQIVKNGDRDHDVGGIEVVV